ncbi:MAG: hypothetical protein IJS39_13360 [Synergistaceae bacterium]|nr:hypothetical protein [Synergistaceae bacterium]
MSILSGLEVELVLNTGASAVHKVYDSFVTLHDAAVAVWQIDHKVSQYMATKVLRGEFHDTQSGYTWSIEPTGKSKGDYRREKKEAFIARWRDESLTIPITKKGKNGE